MQSDGIGGLREEELSVDRSSGMDRRRRCGSCPWAAYVMDDAGPDSPTVTNVATAGSWRQHVVAIDKLTVTSART
jgi:hypothetical protein